MKDRRPRQISLDSNDVSFDLLRGEFEHTANHRSLAPREGPIDPRPIQMREKPLERLQNYALPGHFEN